MGVHVYGETSAHFISGIVAWHFDFFFFGGGGEGGGLKEVNKLPSV